jgi:hypothetical protein
MKHISILLISAATIAVPAQVIGGVVGVGATMATWEAMRSLRRRQRHLETSLANYSSLAARWLKIIWLG